MPLFSGEEGLSVTPSGLRKIPDVCNIPAGLPFLDILATALLEETGGAPERLSGILLFLPTRRACSAMRDAFLRQTDGRPLLLPDIRPLGDGDPEELSFLLDSDLPGGESLAWEELLATPAIAPLERLLILTRLVQAAQQDRSLDQAALLAKELAKLLDAAQTESLDLERLHDLVPEELSGHWAISLKFLKILSEHWPDILKGEGRADAIARRNSLLELQCRLWEESPPRGPVIAAGATGSIPAVARLMGVISRLPQGLLLLPGLDRGCSPADFRAIRAEPTHPQHMLALLLEGLELSPEAVPDWSGIEAWRARNPEESRRLEAKAGARRALLREFMRPAETSAVWSAPESRLWAEDPGSSLESAEGEEAAGPAFAPEQAEDTPLALQGLSLLSCEGQREEAETIALLLREVLEHEGRSATVVTPDRNLARRIAAVLKRWNIEIDDSAGRPLRETPPAVFLRLTAEALAEDMAPVPLLAALKHPMAVSLSLPEQPDEAPALAALRGLSAGQFRLRVRLLELKLLRGARPAPGLAGLRRVLDGARTEAAERSQADRLLQELATLETWLEGFEKLASPFEALMNSEERQDFLRLLDAHIAFAQGLSDQGRRLWTREDGEAARDFIAGLRAGAGMIGQILPREYPGLLDALMQGQNVRAGWNRHPRLSILGPMEARLNSADLLVLAGLNESVWPADPRPDPWMSRGMRQKFGLPSPERMTGLSAHDFVSFLACPRVVITRALRQDGAPTVPSRWLMRLDAVLSAAGQGDSLDNIPVIREWQRALDLTDGREIRTEKTPTLGGGKGLQKAPAPCPPVDLRPEQLSVTRIETWLRDPYSIYASEILGLYALEDLDADPGGAELGTHIHACLDAFVQRFPREIPPDAEEQLLAIGREVWGETLDRPGVWAFWWPRFERIVRWVVETESQRRHGLAACHSERKGRAEFTICDRPFTLTAQADRIDLDRKGHLLLIDYKTGGLPSKKDVDAGFSPQLPLEGVIALDGGFQGVGKPEESMGDGAIAGLLYWRLKGARIEGESRDAGNLPASGLVTAARDGLVRLVRQFRDENMPFMPVPRLSRAPAFNNYHHLERIDEWIFAPDGEEDAEADNGEADNLAIGKPERTATADKGDRK